MIFPRNNHFKVAMTFSFIIGVWPFVFKDSPILRALYKAYAKFWLTVFTVFVLCTYIKILILGGETKTEEISANLCITLLCTMILLKLVVFKSPKMLELIKSVFEIEERIYAENDKEAMEQYDLCVAMTNRIGLIYIAVCVVVVSVHYSFPTLTTKKVLDEGTNRTITVGDFPVSIWIPWDSQKHYWRTYFFVVWTGGLTAAPMVVFMDIFMFSLIIFPSGQLEVLMHQVKNFKKYSKEVQNLLGCSADDASFFTIRQFIIRHKDIIRYVNSYNEEMKYLTLFDFLVSSIQLAALTIQLVRSDCGPLDMINWGGFVACMIMRLLLYYWHANEIMVKSSNLGSAIWECEWFEQPYRVKQLMLLMIARSQRPLSLNIGNFSAMTLERFLSIVKAAYSYVMIMYR